MRCLPILVLLLASSSALAVSGFRSRIPNGTLISCIGCHSTAAGCFETLASALIAEPEPPEPLAEDPEGYFRKVVNLDVS